MSGHGFHPRACTGKRTPRGYTKNGNSENVVVINVDDDDDDVIIIDYPDSRGEKEAPRPTVISIDDEDSDVDHPGIGVPGVSELDSDATSNKRFFPSPDTAGNPLDFDANQNHSVQKEKSPSRLSKCQKSYIEKTPCRNRYGFNPDSEDGPSESDYSDCEVLEGSFEELHEQWERTYSKQKSKSFNCRYGAEDQASTSTFHAGAYMNAGQYRNDFFRDQVFSFSNNDKGEEDLSRGNDAYLNTWHKEDLRKRGSSQPDKKTAWLRSQKKGQAQFVTVNGNVQVGEETCTDKGPADAQHENSSGSSMNTLNEDQGRKDSYWWFNIMGGAKQNDCAEEHHEEKDERNDEASCHSSSQSVNCDDEESDSYRSQVFGEANMPKRGFPRDCNNVIFQKESCGNSCSLNEMHEMNVAGYTEELLWDHLVQKSKPFDEINTGKDGNDKGDHVEKSSINCTPIVSHEEPQEKPELLEKRSCSMKDQEPFVKSASTTQSSEERNVDCSPIMQDSIINGREKLKETDEYRRAQEEEWASRQRQLQLQVLPMICFAFGVQVLLAIHLLAMVWLHSLLYFEAACIVVFTVDISSHLGKSSHVKNQGFAIEIFECS